MPKSLFDSNYKAVIFDLDGTLIDSLESFAAAQIKALVENGIDRHSAAELTNDVRMPFDRRLRALKPELEEEKIRKILADYVRVYNTETFKLATPMEGAKHLLNTLEQNSVKAGVVTSRSLLEAAIVPTLERVGLLSYISSIITPSDVAKPKPEPYGHLLSLKRLSVSASSAAGVGDSPEDIIASKKAGILAVAFTSGFYSRSELKSFNPDAYARSLSEILPIVAGGCTADKQATGR